MVYCKSEQTWGYHRLGKHDLRTKSLFQPFNDGKITWVTTHWDYLITSIKGAGQVVPESNHLEYLDLHRASEKE
jgi:hypothetical protein